MERFLSPDTCPVRNVVDRLGDKWSLLVILMLGDAGTMRFGELEKTMMTVSRKMLAVTLQSLESDGIIHRRVYAEVPPRVEYQLTELGKSLLPFIEKLCGWASLHMKEVLENRKKVARRRNTAKKSIVSF